MRRTRRSLGAGLVLVLLVTACGGPPRSAPLRSTGAAASGTAATPALPSPSEAADVHPTCTAVGERWVSPADGATLVCVPAGTFWMGDDPSDPAADEAATPRHEVRLSAYWLDRTEVTNAAYEACVERGVCPPRPTAPGSTGVASKTESDYYHDPRFANHPVLIYTVEEAMAYCECMGRRLPTEAEWERAAGDADGRRYPWGETLDCEHATFYGCTADTLAVDAQPSGASAVGALAMSGNVAEWVADFWADGYGTSTPVVDPTGPTSGEWHVRRGGGFSSLRADLAVTARRSGNPSHYFDGQMGFRCAVTAGPPS